MPVSDQDLDTAKQKFVDNSNLLEAIVKGNDTSDVDIGGGKSLQTIAKLQKQVLQDYAHVEQQANRDASGGFPALTGFKLNLQNAAGAVKSYLASLATATRNWSLPDKDGTIAMTSDISATAVGLDQVNNTSDAAKPISTAQAAAFAAREVLVNKAVDFSVIDDTKYPSTQAVKTLVDNSTVGLLRDQGNWSAAGGTYPNANGSGTAGAIRKGDTFFINVAGNLGGVAVNVGDSVRAMANAPGQTAANWNILEANIGYVPENQASKDATGGYAGLTLFKLNVFNAAGNVKSWFTTLATSARTYTLPDKDGTIAMLSDLTAGEQTTNKDASGGYAGLTLFKLNMRNAANTFTSWFTNTNTAARTYTLPDKDGTVAMLADITGTNSGTNTGDETTATLLTKLGIATSFANGVLNTVLTGLGAGSNAAIAVTDTLLAALAKLQAQIKAIPYDINVYTGATKPAASVEIIFHHAARAFTIPANFVGSKFEALVAATSATVWTLTKNGTTVGTISWAAAGTIPTLATTGGTAISVAIDDKLILTAAATQDATLAKVSGCIAATLT